MGTVRRLTFALRATGAAARAYVYGTASAMLRIALNAIIAQLPTQLGRTEET